MTIELEPLTRGNFHHACAIRREDIPEAFVDTAQTLMELTDYANAHRCIGRTFLAKADGAYVGLLLLGEAIPWETDPEEMRKEPFYRLMGFVLDRAYRGQGLGGAILEQAIAQVYRDFGVRPIALGCHKENVRAAQFYERHGFTRTGVFEGSDEYFLRYPQG